MEFRKTYENIINYILIAFISFSLIYSLTESMLFSDFMGSYAMPLFLIICFLISGCTFLSKNMNNLKISITVTGICAGVILLYILRSPEAARAFLRSLINYWEWLKQYLQFADNFKRLYAIITIFIISLLITPPIYYFIQRRFNFYVILVSGLGLFATQWRKGYFVSFTAFYIFMFLLLTLYFLHIYKRNEANEQSDLIPLSTFFTWIVPICIIVFTVSFQISIRTKPIRISWLSKTLASLLDDADKRGPFSAFDYFSLATAGFGSQDALGGNVRLNNTVVMEVTASRRVYLKGSSRDFYNGTSWNDSKNSVQLLLAPDDSNFIDVMDPNTNVAFENSAPDNPMTMDYLEITEGTRLLGDANSKQRFYCADDIDITFSNINTRSLFVPLKTRMLQYIRLKNPLTTYINKSGVYFAGRILGRNFRYSLTTYTPMYSDEYFINLLRKSEKGLYSEYDRGLKAGVTVDTVRRLDKYAKSIYSIYTQLPDSLPDRVEKLAFSISQSFGNSYDKVKAIENYLVTNYPYTLLPNSTPPGRDFVDYFLFDQKQGYCSYYASAMAIMVRTLGIPARYVEGYILPPKSDAFSKYTVTNQQAHAWVEVYFEGYGWVTFEPTAPFNKAFYNKPKVKEAKFVESFKDDPAYRDYIKQLKAYDEGVEDENNKDILTKQILVITVVIFGAIILIILAIYLYNLIVRRYRLYFVEKMRPRECIITLMAYYMQIFALLGLPIKTGETPTEYGKRISSVLLYDRYAFRNESISNFLNRTAHIEDFYKQSKFTAVMDAFIMARYNPGAVTDEHKKIALAYYGQLMDKARVSMGGIRYYINKYIFGKFNFN